MPKYRKKPIVIEAYQITKDFGPADVDYWPKWLRDAFFDKTFPDPGSISPAFIGPHAVYIVTLEGTMGANTGDYIIRGVKGELYACKEDIFYETYEPYADEETSAD